MTIENAVSAGAAPRRPSIPALSEYGSLVGGQQHALRPPTDFSDIARWFVYGILACLALRLIVAVLRGPSRS